jgi:hypothetical protein
VIITTFRNTTFEQLSQVTRLIRRTHISYLYLSIKPYKTGYSWSAGNVSAFNNAPPPADPPKLLPGQSGSTPTVHCAQGTTNSQPEPRRKECFLVWKLYWEMEDIYDMNEISDECV